MRRRLPTLPLPIQRSPNSAIFPGASARSRCLEGIESAIVDRFKIDAALSREFCNDLDSPKEASFACVYLHLAGMIVLGQEAIP
jgi:hypothetical protein